MKKRVIFICCALFAAITICTAQNNADDKKVAREAQCMEMVKKATERMKNQLSLNDEQTAKVEELNKEYLPKMRMGKPGMRHHKANCPDSICPKKDCPKTNADCKKTDCKKADCKKADKCPMAKKHDKAKEFKKPTKEQMEKHRNEMRETRKAYMIKLNDILTPEQQEKYKSLHKERKGKKPGKNKQ